MGIWETNVGVGKVILGVEAVEVSVCDENGLEGGEEEAARCPVSSRSRREGGSMSGLQSQQSGGGLGVRSSVAS